MEHILLTHMPMIKVSTLIALMHPVDHRTPMVKLHVRSNLHSSLDRVLNLATGNESDTAIAITFCGPPRNKLFVNG